MILMISVGNWIRPAKCCLRPPNIWKSMAGAARNSSTIRERFACWEPFPLPGNHDIRWVDDVEDTLGHYVVPHWTHGKRVGEILIRKSA
jgi:hypothetical protein